MIVYVVEAETLGAVKTPVLALITPLTLVLPTLAANAPPLTVGLISNVAFGQSGAVGSVLKLTAGQLGCGISQPTPIKLQGPPHPVLEPDLYHAFMVAVFQLPSSTKL